MLFDRTEPMSIRLENVVPWGRSLAEYARMFDLSDGDLASKSVLGVGDGPASFNAEMRVRGRRVVSVDPIYVFSAEAIRSRVEATHPRLVQFAREHRDTFVWTARKVRHPRIRSSSDRSPPKKSSTTRSESCCA